MQLFVIALVMNLISYALSPKPPKPRDAVPGEFGFPEPPRGKNVPVNFGTVWVKDAGVLYAGNRSTVSITQTVDSK